MEVDLTAEDEDDEAELQAALQMSMPPAPPAPTGPGALEAAIRAHFGRLVAEGAARFPWLVLPMGIGLLVAAAALIRALHALCLGAPTPDQPVRGAFALPGGMLWATGPVWLHLALAAALGFAAPPAVTALLRAGAELL
jgi:hypothetical protein